MVELMEFIRKGLICKAIKIPSNITSEIISGIRNGLFSVCIDLLRNQI